MLFPHIGELSYLKTEDHGVCGGRGGYGGGGEGGCGQAHSEREWR